MQLSGEIAVVSGASSGIGAATARLLAEKGAHVVLLARREGALRDVAAQITLKGGKAAFYPVDLSDSAAVSAVARRIAAEVGPPAIIVNNAPATVCLRAPPDTGHLASVDEFCS